jgi:DNA-directed RNA polymerase specialized sigma24 family protein
MSKKSKSKLDLGEILQRVHPRIYRLAIALCESRHSGMAVVARVFAHSGVLFERWESQDEADRWFLRYTVLCSRDQKSAEHQDNALISVANTPACRAAILSVWHLPMQQREAFLLHHGENLDLRQLAMAMDCSSSAAKNHLAAAEKSFRAVLGDDWPDFMADLPGLMQQLLPSAEIMEVEINAVIRRRRKMLWIQRWVVTLTKCIAIALLGWAVWKIWNAVR